MRSEGTMTTKADAGRRCLHGVVLRYHEMIHQPCSLKSTHVLVPHALKCERFIAILLF